MGTVGTFALRESGAAIELSEAARSQDHRCLAFAAGDRLHGLPPLPSRDRHLDFLGDQLPAEERVVLDPVEDALADQLGRFLGPGKLGQIGELDVAMAECLLEALEDLERGWARLPLFD